MMVLFVSKSFNITDKKNSMKKIVYTILAALLFGQICLAQTITKTASNNNPHIGEEFFYTIKVENLSDLSDLDFIVDNLGPEMEYLGVNYHPSLLALTNGNLPGNLGCSSFSDSASSAHSFRLDFINCLGNTFSGFDTFSFDIKVKLNDLACNLTDVFNNTAKLYLKSTPNKPILSNTESINVNRNDPFVLQKNYRATDSSGFVIYDVRLSSASGDFYPLDFNAQQIFKDEFTFPSCVNLDLNNVEVVHIIDENTSPMTQSSNFLYTKSISGNTLTIEWDLQGASEFTTSILYQVKIKTDDCSTCTQNYTLQNTVYFNGLDRCGSPINKSANSIIDNAHCSGGITSVPDPIDCFIKFSKNVSLNGNVGNYTMKGCKGKYIINIENCSGVIDYDFTLQDTLPTGLSIDDGQINITGNANYQFQNNQLTVTPINTKLYPNERVTIEIPFEVTETRPNIPINNCATLHLDGADNLGNPYVFTEQACAPTIATVPNQVAVVAKKYNDCIPAGSKCGGFTNPHNLPGDEVEYALEFYNYGTVEGINVAVRDVLPPHFKIQDLNNDVKVYVAERSNFSSLCDMSGANDITQKIKKQYDPTSNLLEIDMNGNKLNEFTCEGITKYLVKIKAKIELTAPNGVYDNIFIVQYNDPNMANSQYTISNKVTNVVNVENLVLGAKTHIAEDTDCENKTKKVTYEIIIANMGTFPVGVNINDVLLVPSPASVVSFGNFQMSTNGNPATPFNVPNVTNTGYNRSFSIQPCEYKILTYEVVYNTNLIFGNETVEVCNNAEVKVFVKDEKKSFPLITGEPSLIQRFFNAKTDTEKLNTIALIKAHQKSLNKNLSGTVDLGSTRFSECVTLDDCLNGSEQGCFSATSQQFNFQITGMNRNGEITTTLNNIYGDITQIEYILTDVRQIDTCEDDVAIIKGKPITRSCFGCSDNVTGVFSTIDTSPIGFLSYINQPVLPGKYKESNKVVFKGAPTLLTQDNRTFKFPVPINCNGTYEFTITAIVHFKDCSVCYVSDSFDYNASYRWVFPRPRTPMLVGPSPF